MARFDLRSAVLTSGKSSRLPRMEEWRGQGSPTEWVISVNLKRRHLTQSQKAAVATESLPLFESEAKERQKKQAKANQPQQKQNPQRIADLETCPICETEYSAGGGHMCAMKGEAREKAAKAVGVNRQYVSDAKAIKEKSPETFEKVLSGEMTIPQAKKQKSRPG